jgi:tRNA modification GTPase
MDGSGSEGGDCQVSVLTPIGRGAVATVAVVGESATALVAQQFRAAAGRPLDQFPISRIVLGRWSDPAGPGEELVVARRSLQDLEVHCHGGVAAVRVIVDSLVALGCREVPWQELAAARAPDLVTAEALAALAAAPTERTAAVLLDQHRGALAAAVARLQAELLRGATTTAREELERLLRGATLGLHLTRPWRVVLVGRANVGKSSLINAWLGYQRSIVWDQPGTTRDVVTAYTALEGWPVELADTAGLRDSPDPLEAAGEAQARQHLEAADAVILAFDRTQPWTDDDARLLRTWPDAVVVRTKCDLPPAGAEERPAGIRTSARIGAGLDDLTRAVVARLVPEPPGPGMAVPFTARQVEILRAATAALQAGDVRGAVAALQEVVGGRSGNRTIRSAEPPNSGV